jgi:DNA-binding response OmpR family regulator
MNAEDAAPARLLVVDDQPDNRNVLNRFFSRRGFEIVEAADGATALRLIAAQSFDAVLLDIVMPGMNGFEVLNAIRLSHSPSHLPVIMVTAKVDTEDVVEALQLGANDYVTKPINFSIANARLQNQLARKQAEHRLAIMCKNWRRPITGWRTKSPSASNPRSGSATWPSTTR